MAVTLLPGLERRLKTEISGEVHFDPFGRGRYATLGAIVNLLGSWSLLDLGAHSLAALIAGTIALDLGVQALHISNQSAIYALRPQARSRLNTAYMVAYFLGGAVLSAAASLVYSAAGWNGICTLGALTAAAALWSWLATNRREPTALREAGR